MESDIGLSPRWKGILFANAVFPAATAVVFIVGDTAWWRIVLAVAMLATSGVNLLMFRKAVHAPLISFRRDELALRNMYEREVTRIPRPDVEGVVWANHTQICLQLRSGLFQSVNLIGLDRWNKDAVRAQLESWRDGFQPGRGRIDPAHHRPC
jgi:hypothetical protein